MAAMHICIPVTVVKKIYGFSSKHDKECVGVCICVYMYMYRVAFANAAWYVMVLYLCVRMCVCVCVCVDYVWTMCVQGVHVLICGCI